MNKDWLLIIGGITFCIIFTAYVTYDAWKSPRFVILAIISFILIVVIPSGYSAYKIYKPESKTTSAQRSNDK